MIWSIYVTLSSITVITLATSSFGCSDKPRLSASRQRNLLMGNSHRFYRGTAPGLSLAGRHAYRNTTARSSALCSVYCLLSDECKSFNYCMDNKICQLNSAVYSENEETLVESNGCLYFDENVPEAVPCQVYKTTASVVFTNEIAIPVHLEFVAVSDIKLVVGFMASGRDFEVELKPSSSSIEEIKMGSSILRAESGIEMLATQVVIDVNNTHITVGQKEIPESQFSLEYPPTTDPGFKVLIKSDADATWAFYNPCNALFV